MRLREWTRDATLGKALIVAGVVFFIVQVLPSNVVAGLARLWPLALIAAGLLLIRRPRG